MKKWLFGLIVLSSLHACGPSATDLIERESLKTQLIELKSQLAGEETKLQNVEGLHLFRTKARKAQEAADQTRVIEELRLRIFEIERRLDN